MKFLSLTSFFRVSILACVMLSAGSLSAQLNENTRPNTTTMNRDNVRDNVRTERDNDHDWGWIGLLGLIGLAGLLPKNRTHDHDRGDTRGDNRGDTGNRTLNR